MRKLGCIVLVAVAAMAMAVPAASTNAVVPSAHGSGPVVFRSGTWFIGAGDGNYFGVIDSFRYGDPGDVPVMGDWDGDGRTTPGVRRGNTWYLSNAYGDPASYVVQYGDPGDLPVVGDWSHSGHQSIGVVRGNTWFLKDTIDGSGVADRVFTYGDGGDRPVAGDWNFDGVDTPAVVRSAGDHDLFYIRNSNTSGVADYTPNPVAAGTPVQDYFPYLGRHSLPMTFADGLFHYRDPTSIAYESESYEYTFYFGATGDIGLWGFAP